MPSDETLPEQPPDLPEGIILKQILEGHEGPLMNMAFDPSGEMLASCAGDNTARVWDLGIGKTLHVLRHENWVRSVAFDSTGLRIASGSDNCDVKLWDARTGRERFQYLGHPHRVFSVAFQPNGDLIASGSDDRSVHLWRPGQVLDEYPLEHSHWVYAAVFSPDGKMLAVACHDNSVWLWDVERRCSIKKDVTAHKQRVWTVAFHPHGRFLASGSKDGTIKIWDAKTLRLLRSLELHRGGVQSVVFSRDGQLLISKARDGRVILWNCSSWEPAATLQESAEQGAWLAGMAFHPTLPLLATGGPSNGKLLHLWALDMVKLTGRELEVDPVGPTRTPFHYINAKVVLMGDSGAGKTSLVRVLAGGEINKNESSTHAREVDILWSDPGIFRGVPTLRELFVWDLGGQSHYRIIHQLHLAEVTVALLVFDAGSGRDPLSGVRYWSRALRLANQSRSEAVEQMRVFLVSARIDRGSTNVSTERLKETVRELQLDGYFETSAAKQLGIKELRNAIIEGVPWGQLPLVSSNQLFRSIRQFVIGVRSTKRLLITDDRLFELFRDEQPEEKSGEKLRSEFDASIEQMENRGLIRRMSFGGILLLRPEILDSFASSMLAEAKKQPDGMGSIYESDAIAGKFFEPLDEETTERERILLPIATIEELIRHALTFREYTKGGYRLVFPSEFNRDFEVYPEPEGQYSTITFEAPIQTVFATLVVKLGHSGEFSLKREEMWRNAAEFTARAGGTCGLYVNEYNEARGRLITFFTDDTSAETKSIFDGYVRSYVNDKARQGTVKWNRFYVCGCGIPVQPQYVDLLLGKNRREFPCPCGRIVPLDGSARDDKRRWIHLELEETANKNLEFHARWISALGEVNAPRFKEWAGSARLTMAFVMLWFVDDSGTKIEVPDEGLLSKHWNLVRSILPDLKGFEIKVFTDSMLAAFHDVTRAIHFAEQVVRGPASGYLHGRAAINIGPVTIEADEVWSETINSVIEMTDGTAQKPVLLSERAEFALQSITKTEKATSDFSSEAVFGMSERGCSAVGSVTISCGLHCPHCDAALPINFEMECRKSLANARCGNCNDKIVHLWEERWSPPDMSRFGVAMIVTDIKGCSSIRHEHGDHGWTEVQTRHFCRAKDLIGKEKGCWAGDAGDLVAACFSTVEQSLSYFLSFRASPGDPRIKGVRGVIDSDMVILKNGQFLGQPWFRTARMLKAMGKKVALWLSDRAKKDLDNYKDPKFLSLRWNAIDVRLDDFPDEGIWELDESGDSDRGENHLPEFPPDKA